MTIIIGIIATLAILCLAIIFGTDMSAALVLRPVYADLDDRTLVQVTGRGHYYGDRRFPPIGIVGTIASALAVPAAFLWGSALTGILSLVALVLLLIWLTLFARISKPINAKLTAAAFADEVPSDTRALQARWESIIVLRAVLLGVAIALLAVVLFLV